MTDQELRLEAVKIAYDNSTSGLSDEAMLKKIKMIYRFLADGQKEGRCPVPANKKRAVDYSQEGKVTLTDSKQSQSLVSVHYPNKSGFTLRVMGKDYVVERGHPSMVVTDENGGLLEIKIQEKDNNGQVFWNVEIHEDGMLIIPNVKSFTIVPGFGGYYFETKETTGWTKKIKGAVSLRVLF